MKSLHIRNIDPWILDRLKHLARAHNRSLQGELLTILTRAARLAPPEDGEEDLDLITVKTGRESNWSRGEIYGNRER